MAAITFPHLVCFQALLNYQTQSWIYQSFKKNKHWFSLVNITWVLMFTSSPTLEHSFRLKANRSLKEAVLWLNAYIWLSSVKLLQLNSYSSALSGRCELSSSFNFRCWHQVFYPANLMILVFLIYILCPASRWPWTSSLWTSASLSTRLSLSWSNQTWWSSRHKSLLQTLRVSSSPHSQVSVIKYNWTGPVWRQSHHMISYSASRLLKTAFFKCFFFLTDDSEVDLSIQQKW